MNVNSKSGAANSSMLLAFVKVITTLLSMVTTRMLCSVLSETEYGTYAQVLLIVSTISSISILGMTDGVNYFYNRYNGEKKAEEYVATIFFIQLLVSIVGIIFVLSGRKIVIQYFNNNSLDKLLIFAALLPLMQNLIAMLQVLFISIGKAKLIAYRNLIISILNLCCFSIGCYLTHEIFFLFVVMSMLNFFQILYFVISLMRNGIKIRIRSIRLKLSGKILEYCIPMEMFIITNALSRDMDKYVISAFESTEVVAMYTNAAKCLPFDIIMTSFLTVMVPILTRLLGEHDYDSSKKLYSHFLMFSCISTMILASGVIPLAEEMVQTLYSAKYIAATPIFRVYVLIDIIRFMSLSIVLSASGKTNLLMKISIGALGANLILNVIFYKTIGIIGTSIATLIVMLVSGMLMICFSARIMQTTPSEILNKNELMNSIMKIVFLCIVELLLKIAIGTFVKNYFFTLIFCYSTYLILALLLFRRQLLYYYMKLNRR